MSGVLLFIILFWPEFASAEPKVTFSIDSFNDRSQVATVLQMLGVLTIIAVAPSIILLTTSFTRTIIVLAFLKQATGTQNLPPSQVIMGISLFLTMFIMAPTGLKVYNEAVKPYMAEQSSFSESLEKAKSPIRTFMLRQTREKDLLLFYDISGKKLPQRVADVPFHILLPSFIISEITTAFKMGFLIFLPFLVIDLVIASVLMAMGMVMLPPALISLPFKIMLFVVADGWNLILGSLTRSFG
ncbi:MAG: flagellar type III secretion system pore protein FliP [Deltaproteobacteria bacterium]|nr:flagellar type III secretion system pore protein FliP [Deltaproteobacteria bacterium]